MIQHPTNAILDYNEPTQDQQNGIFDAAGEPVFQQRQLQLRLHGALPDLQRPLAADANWTKDSSGNLHIPTTDYDQNITGALKLYPLPNTTADRRATAGATTGLTRPTFQTGTAGKCDNPA